MNASSTAPQPFSFLDPVSNGIISTILYFDIFHYPLTLDEIKLNCHGIQAAPEEMEKAVHSLVAARMLFEKKGYYFLSKDNSLIERRIEGNGLAARLMKKARFFSSFISQFPFVRCVCISGSLSKGFMDKDSDVDYFIITRPGRLWVCRTLLVLFKKIFLLNSKKYFCVNYFIDQENLEIPDKNIFTATELSFILPVYNYELYHRLIMSNSWCRRFYPNKKIARDLQNLEFKSSIVKRAAEWVFNGSTGEKFDAFLFRFTLRHWKKKFPYFDETSFNLNLRSRKNVSKHHPQGFQYRVLSAFEEKKRNYEQLFNVSLAG